MFRHVATGACPGSWPRSGRKGAHRTPARERPEVRRSRLDFAHGTRPRSPERAHSWVAHMHTMALAAAGPAGFLNFLQAIKIGITAGAIYALVALGYTLVYGIIELINFAHGDVFMWGTQVTFVLITALGITSTI